MTEKEQLLTEFLENIRDHMDGVRLADENRIGIVFHLSCNELRSQLELYPNILEYTDDDYQPELIVNGVTFCLECVCCSDRFMIAWDEDMSINTLLTHYLYLKKNTEIPCSLDISCKMCTCS